MNCIDIQAFGNTRDLVAIVQSEENPVVVLDGEDECLVAMRPAVFERILFDVDSLKCVERETLRL